MKKICRSHVRALFLLITAGFRVHSVKVEEVIAQDAAVLPDHVAECANGGKLPIKYRAIEPPNFLSEPMAPNSTQFVGPGDPHPWGNASVVAYNKGYAEGFNLSMESRNPLARQLLEANEARNTLGSQLEACKLSDQQSKPNQSKYRKGDKISKGNF